MNKSDHIIYLSHAIHGSMWFLVTVSHVIYVSDYYLLWVQLLKNPFGRNYGSYYDYMYNDGIRYNTRYFCLYISGLFLYTCIATTIPKSSLYNANFILQIKEREN